MPKRTNDFQDLVALIERVLAPRGAKITESALVLGANEEEREIDVLIESPLGPYSMKVAVEAKDEKRKMDIVRFESIVGKYSKTSGIKVNQVVVVSRVGFSGNVVDRATAENIQLLTLTEALNTDWEKKYPQQMIFAIEPHIAQFEFNPALNGLDPGRLAREATLVCTCCGKSRGTPWQLAFKILANQDVRHDIRVAASKAQAMVCSRPKWSFGPKIVLRHNAIDYPINDITAHIHCTFGRTALKVKSYEHSDQVVHHFAGTAAGKSLQLAVPDGEHPEQIAFRISDVVPVSDKKFPGPSIESAPYVPLGTPPAELVAKIRKTLEGLDVQYETSALLHNFASGSTVPVNLLVRIYYSAGFRLRTAIVVHLSESPVGTDLIKHWESLSPALEIDRVMIVSSIGFTEDALRACEKTPYVRAYQDKLCTEALLSAIVPPLAVWSCAAVELNAELFSPLPRRFVPNNNSKLRLGDKVDLGVPKFADILLERLFRASQPLIVDTTAPKAVYAKAEIQFACRLPCGLQLTSETGEESLVGLLKGRAQIRGLFVPLDQIKSVGNGGQYLLFGNADTKYPSLSACHVPGREGFELTGGSLADPFENITRRLPATALDNLLLPALASELAAESSAIHKVATINIQNNNKYTWRMQVYPLASAGLTIARNTTTGFAAG
jgi:hypothetical protein